MDLLENQIVDPINHWYYRHKFMFIKKYIGTPNSVTDIGAGSALFSRELSKLYPMANFYAHDVNYQNDIEIQEDNMIFSNNSEYRLSDVYLLTDVLEHIENDTQFLSKIVQSAPNDARFIITVPCFNILWSGHDVFLKHFRRYKKNELKQLVRSSGLKIQYFQYLYFSLFFFALISRKFFSRRRIQSQLKNVNRFYNFILFFLCKFDHVFRSHTPFGVSCILIASKTTDKNRIDFDK
ncbi:MAG: hypothetical protein RLZZ44_1040 [Bacteroidota bacterium]|jgi:hypothetical protein